MPKVWTDDTALMEGMTDNLFEALYKMPKYFLRIDDIAHSLGMPISSLLVLCVLREGKISIGEISERLCIAKPNVTIVARPAHHLVAYCATNALYHCLAFRHQPDKHLAPVFVAALA